MGPLQGVVALELGSVLMAPYAGQWLADLGADVIKVEPPSGDVTREIGPRAEAAMGSLFLGVNRNKRSVVLDLKTPEGHAALLALVDRADVLLHNNRPQKMVPLGLDPEALLARNPRLVYACLHGFGEAGPYAGRPAYDDIIQGMCGWADLMGQVSKTPGYVPMAAADKIAGLVGAVSILAALSRRDRTGQGGYVDVPMFESLVAFTAVEHLHGGHFDPPRGPFAYPRVVAPDRRPFPTADGHLCALPYTDEHWGRFFEAAGRTDLAADPRFQTMSGRSENIAELYGEVSAVMRGRTTTEWMAVLDALEIPNGPVNSLETLTRDPHLEAVGLFQQVDGPDGSPMRLVRAPVTFDGERPPARMPPRLGEHTREVLLEAGLSAAEVEALGGARS